MAMSSNDEAWNSDEINSASTLHTHIGRGKHLCNSDQKQTGVTQTPIDRSVNARAVIKFFGSSRIRAYCDECSMKIVSMLNTTISTVIVPMMINFMTWLTVNRSPGVDTR